MTNVKPEAMRLADALEVDQQGIYLGAEGMSWGPRTAKRTAAAAELRRLHTENTALRVTEDNLRQELQECQDQRRAAFRRIEELDAMRAQIGQGEPVAWKWRNIKTDSEGVHLEDPKTVGIDVTHPAYEWTPLYTHPAQQQTPLTDEQASVVQQEPVAWAKDTGKKLRITTMQMGNDDGWRPLVYGDTQLAQQAKPQPLTREQVKGLCESAGYYLASPTEQADFINGIRHGEAAHGIKE